MWAKQLLNSRKATLLFLILFGAFLPMFTWLKFYRAPSEEICFPKTNIVFLKTHKAASTAVCNMFMRYANQHDLLVAIPLRGNYFGHPQPFQPSMVPALKPNNSYNMLIHHTRFNYSGMKEFLPSTDTVFITILREPISQFESMYNYYSLYKYFEVNLEGYANLDLKSKKWQSIQEERATTKISYNQMSFDLGLNPSTYNDSQAILQAAQQLDQQFHLVMIQEMMDESTILLKELLCWDNFDNFVMLKVNARQDKYRKSLSEDTKQKLREKHQADHILYSYFKQRLLERIEEYGQERMQKEIAKLQERRSYYNDKCIESDDVERSKYSKKDRDFKPYSDKVKGFRLKEEAANDIQCLQMAMGDLQFDKKTFEKQKHFLQGN